MHSSKNSHEFSHEFSHEYGDFSLRYENNVLKNKSNYEYTDEYIIVNIREESIRMSEFDGNLCQITIAFS